MSSSVVHGVGQGLAEVDTGGYAESQAKLNATVADIQNAAAVERQQQAHAAPQSGASGAFASRPAAQLQPQPQPQRQAQPQPHARLQPRSSAGQAREIVYGMKCDVIARCRASGREATSEGSFNFQLNQVQADEERPQGMRARHSEDVSVSL